MSAGVEPRGDAAQARTAAPVIADPVRRLALTCAALVAVAGIGWLDVVTGADIGLSIFYLMPIVACGWWLGPRPAAVVAATAAVVWTIADLLTQDYGVAASTWNGFTRLATYMLIGIVVAIARRDRLRLAELLVHAESLARTDALTGLANFRALDERLRGELPRLARNAAPVCLAYVDLDNFKRVNDRYGHERGDALLRDIAAGLRESVRTGDVVARIGGDEIAILLWDCTPQGAHEVCARVLAHIQRLGEDLPGTDLGASAGIAWFPVAPPRPQDVLARADAAMYQAKHGGKHRIVLVTHDAEAIDGDARGAQR